MAYLIVEFNVGTSEDPQVELEIVPNSWYVTSLDKCWWPPLNLNRDAVKKFILKSKPFDVHTWICSDARIVAGFKSYTDAVAKMPDALNGQLIEITDIENRGRGRRKKKRVKRFHDTFSEDSQSEDNEVPGTSSSIPATAKPQPRNSNSELPKSNFPSIPVDLEMDFPSRIRQHSRSSVFASRSPSPTIDQPSNIVETPRAPNAGRKPTAFQERFQLNLSHSRSDGQVIAKKSVPINASPEAAKAFEVVIKKLEYLTRSMEIVKATQREQLSTLSILLRNTAPPEPQVNNISKEFGFPLNTMAGLRSLESTLNEDQAKLKLVFSVLVTCHVVISAELFLYMRYESRPILDAAILYLHRTLDRVVDGNYPDIDSRKSHLNPVIPSFQYVF